MESDMDVQIWFAVIDERTFQKSESSTSLDTSLGLRYGLQGQGSQHRILISFRGLATAQDPEDSCSAMCW